ncbi:MAG: pyridoxamine 5'-phosphate oxidase family protein, partial [Aquihabitans sp.]
MGRSFDAIADHLVPWMEEQPIYFVASAPLSAEGHVNVSPKGGDSFRVLGPNAVAYLDFTGSGAETIAHPRENGRLTIMFASFGPKPN